MREIKFRGKRKDNREWVEGYYFIDERDIEDGIIWRDIPQIQQRYGDHFNYFDVDPSTIGQFTGLHDKNGVEIYEGDIVKYKDRETAEVTYQPSEFVLVFKSQEFPQIGLLCESWKNNFEVIGNIHERKEEK